MDFLHNLKKVKRSTSEKAKYFLEAKQNINEVKIEYVNQSGRMSKRVILPKELYKNSRGTIYVQAYCNQAQESRTFLLNKITLVEVPEYNKSSFGKAFRRSPVCSVTGCDNLAEIRNKTGKHNVYRKTCTTCRRRVLQGLLQKRNAHASTSKIAQFVQSLAATTWPKSTAIIMVALNTENLYKMPSRCLKASIN